METKPKHISVAIRVLTGILIIASIIITYRTMIVNHDYEVFTNPDGPDLEE